MKRVYLGNISYGMKEDKLNEICSAYGTVTSVKVITDRETGRSRGFAFVEMETPEQANALIEALNEKDMDGRKVIAAIAREKQERDNNRGGGFNRRGGGRDRGFNREENY